MRTPKYYLILLLLFLTTITDSCLAQQGDVFFLVDVSGSMRSTEINSEAKQIVLELMQGNFSMSDWETKGWKSVNSSGVFFNRQNNSMLLDKGIFCLMPFGNMETVRKYQMMTFNSTNNQSFGDFYQKAFPKSHNEEYTFLSLAKAYSVVLAAQKGLEGKKIWLIVYSDGMGDSMDSNNFPDDLQKAWDYFGTTSASIMQKNGVLRKTNPRKHYDIEVWTMGPIPKIIDTTTPPPPPPAPLPFKITSPQQGISVKTRASSTGLRFSRWMFSIRETSIRWRSLKDLTIQGTVFNPASFAALNLRSPATITNTPSAISSTRRG